MKAKNDDNSGSGNPGDNGGDNGGNGGGNRADGKTTEIVLLPWQKKALSRFPRETPH